MADLQRSSTSSHWRNTLEIKPPPIPLNVLEYLEKMYPDKSPNPTEDIDLIRVKSGQVSVHRHLRRVYDDQMKHFTMSI